MAMQVALSQDWRTTGRASVIRFNTEYVPLPDTTVENE